MKRVLFVHAQREFSLAYWVLRQAVQQYCVTDVAFFEHAYVLDDVDNQETLRIRLALLHPDVVLFSCQNWNLKAFLEVAGWVRHFWPAATIVLGGPQVSSLLAAETLLRTHQSIDFVVRGPGEIPLCGLLDTLFAGRSDNVSSLSYRDGDAVAHTAIVHTPWRRERLFTWSNIELVQRLREVSQVSYETTRGCSSRCIYCQYPSENCDVEMLDEKLVLEELTFLCSFHIPHLRICDAHLGGTRERAKTILRHLAKVNRKTSIKIYPDISHVDEEYLDLVRASGARITSIGVQSTHTPILKAIRRKSVQAFRRQIRMTLDAFPDTPADVILGLPGGGVDAFRQTLMDVRRLGFSWINVFRLTVFPGTELATNVCHFLGEGPIGNTATGVVLSSPEYPLEQQQEIATLVAAAKLGTALRHTAVEVANRGNQPDIIRLLTQMDAALLHRLATEVENLRTPVPLLEDIFVLSTAVVKLAGYTPALVTALCFDILTRAKWICARNKATHFIWANEDQLVPVSLVVARGGGILFSWELEKQSISTIGNEKDASGNGEKYLFFDLDVFDGREEK